MLEIVIILKSGSALRQGKSLLNSDEDPSGQSHSAAKGLEVIQFDHSFNFITI